MARFVDFSSLLLEDKRDKLGRVKQDLPSQENIFFGPHAYILREEVILSDVLKETRLASIQSSRTIHHLFIYCHKLRETLTDGKQLRISVEDFLGLKTLTIYTAQLPSFQELVTVGDGRGVNYPFRLRLYFDCNYGPPGFWLNPASSVSPAPIHVVRDEASCLSPETVAACENRSHIDLSTSNAVGLQIDVASRSSGGVTSAQAIQSVPTEEFEPLKLEDFQHWGPDIQRLRNLSRLLCGMFSSAGQEAMRFEPDVTSTVAKLQFIKLCVRNEPRFAGLAQESGKLLSRLQRPREFPEGLADGNKSTEQAISTNGSLEAEHRRTAAKSAWIYVPQNTPKPLREGMTGHVEVLRDALKALEAKESEENIKNAIMEQGDEIVKAVRATVNTEVTQVRISDMVNQATYNIKSAADKVRTLQSYASELNSAKDAFDTGIAKYEAEQKKKAKAQLFAAIFEVVVSVGVAVYSGGAGAPMTVGAVNKLMQGAKGLKEASRLWMAIKALVKACLKVGPKIKAALDCQKALERNQAGAAAGDAKKEAKDLAEKMVLLGGDATQQLDYGNLLAEWREMDISVDVTFTEIRAELGKDSIDGMVEYQISLKKLSVRGETLVNALKEAYETYRQGLLLQAELMSQNKLLSSIAAAHEQVLETKTLRDAAYFMIKHEMEENLAQRGRIVFNLLQEGVHALIYQTNDIRLQKDTFASLSPSMSASALTRLWATFTSAVIQAKQGLIQSITVNAAEAFPTEWRSLLLNDYETPFQIPPTLTTISSQHRMRIRSLSAKFPGLRRMDKSETGLAKIPYTFKLGPLMIDRASPADQATSSSAFLIQYYMPEGRLSKQGDEGKWNNEEGTYANRALCCMGKLRFDRSKLDMGKEEERWDLSTIKDIELHLEYETLEFMD